MPFTRLVEELSQRGITVHGEFSAQWGAATAFARPSIRRSILAHLPQLSAEDENEIKDLAEVPRPADWSVSISHTRDLGGWMAVARPAQVGWDIEIRERIRPEVIARVCSREEVVAAPEAAFLWPAKEAYFKALEDDQPATVIPLTVTDWRTVGPGLWQFTGLGPLNGEGLVTDIGGVWLAAVCLVPDVSL